LSRKRVAATARPAITMSSSASWCTLRPTTPPRCASIIVSSWRMARFHQQFDVNVAAAAMNGPSAPTTRNPLGTAAPSTRNVTPSSVVSLFRAAKRPSRQTSSERWRYENIVTKSFFTVMSTSVLTRIPSTTGVLRTLCRPIRSPL
jgi:hypothetical protein